MKLFKRSFHYAIGVLALAFGTLLPSCTQESFIESQEYEDEGIEMVIHVGDQTRTTNNGTGTLWAEGDELTVIHSAPGGSDFLASRFSKNAGENSFTGKVKRLSATNDWYVVYPYQADNVDAGQLSFTFPANQTQAGNASTAHLAGEHFPLVAKSLNLVRGNQLSVTMQNVLHVLEFDFENKTESANPVVVKEVQFTATSAIAGSFNVDLTGDNPVVTAGSGATKVVTLGVSNGASISANGTSTFYMAIAPFTAPAGSVLKIKVTATDTVTNSTVIFYRSITVGADGRTFSPGTIQQIGVEFDENHSQNPDAGSGTEVELPVGGEPEDGVYLLVYENGANSYAFAAFDEYKSQHYAIPVVVENGVVLPQDGIDLARFAVKLENTGEEHPNDEGHDAYNVRNSDGKYVFYATAGGTYEAEDALHIMDINEMEVQGTTYKYYHTFEQTTDGVRIVCSIATGGNKYLFSYTATDGFNYQQDNASGTNLHLFLLGGSVKEKQNPYFSQERVEYDFDASGSGVLANAPTLTGAMTSVTYSSSNESVASVDADGNVTIHKAGTATITATAAADDVYYSATAQYLIVATTSAGTTFYRVTEFTAGEQYLIVSAGKALTNNNGTIDATDVPASGDEVIVSDAASMMWTATASGSGYTLSNNGYYVQRASSQGGGKPSISDNPNTSYYVWNYSNNRLFTGSTYYLYYSSGWSQTSSSSSAGTVTIYSSTKPLTKQTLSFTQESVTWVIGEGYEINGNYAFPQTVTGNVTPVNYTSSNTSVATISGNRITIVATGWTTIKARTEGNDEYAPAEASYTLRIREQVSGDFVDLGVFNLENADVAAYLTAAEDEYPDTGISSPNISYTMIRDYSRGGKYSTISNYTADYPAPVPINWGKASSGSTVITVYNDETLSDEEWHWTAATGSTSFDVYNLIPGRTYWCTVEDTDGIFFKGTFMTEGRRRMLKISETKSQDNARNCRDLGGLKTTDGKRIRYGFLFRGTNLNGTSDTEKNLLVNYLNIGLDNDLRQDSSSGWGWGGSGGSGNTTDVFASTSYNVHYCAPSYDSNIDELTTPSKVQQTMQAFIDVALGRYQDNGVVGKAAYFHCFIGSDRTGFWGLLVEGLLGVSIKDCSIDYELTSFADGVGSVGVRTRNTQLFNDGINFFKGKTNYGSTLQERITHFLVNDCNISSQDIDAFKATVLEDDPDQ